MDEIIERRVKEIEERRARGRKGHVAAQESYLERERQKKQAQVDQFVESVARCLKGELAAATERLPLAQRRRIHEAITSCSTAILLREQAK